MSRQDFVAMCSSIVAAAAALSYTPAFPRLCV
jgi:hypothetical protein